MAISLKKNEAENTPLPSELTGDNHTQNNIIYDLQEAEQQKQQRVEHAERRRKAKNYGILAGGILTIAALIAFLLLPGYFYMQAKSALENKQYQDAIGYYSQADGVSLAGGFFDAKYMAETGVYLQQANDGESSGDYDSAMSAYRALGDSANVTRMQYLKANSLFLAGEYIEATNWYASLPEDYEDVKDRILESRYMSAKQHWQEGNFEEAITILGRVDVNKFADSKSLLFDVKYDYALDCIEREDYAKAHALVSDLRRLTNQHKEECTELFPMVSYMYAQQAEAAKDYGTATTMYMNAGDYEDANDREVICSYQYACEMYDSGEYKEAAEHFDLNGYEDSTQRMYQAMYRYVLGNKDCDDDTTFDYLKVLTAVKYEDSQEIYDSLYKWKAKLVSFTTNKGKYSEILTSASRNCRYLTFRFTLSGGPHDKAITVSHRIYWPNGNVTTSNWTWDAVTNGTSFSAEWLDGLGYTGQTGRLKIEIFNKKTGEVLGSGSIRLT